MKYLSYVFLLIMSITSNSASAQSSLNIADRTAIADQVARYSYAADSADLDSFTALFTEDAVFMIIPPGQTEPDTKLESRAAIRKFSEDLNASQPAGTRSAHHQSGLLFTELTEKTARTQNMILVTTQGPDDPAPLVVVSGVYYDSWRKTKDGWQIASRTLRMKALPLSDQ